MDLNYKIIAVDFDGTLCYSNWPELGAPNTMLIDYLLQEKAAGNKLILWTCRAGKALTDATEWCCEQGLTFDAVNDNLPEIVELYGNNSRKITCDLYIDDKSAFIDSMGLLIPWDGSGELVYNPCISSLLSPSKNRPLG